MADIDEHWKALESFSEILYQNKTQKEICTEKNNLVGWFITFKQEMSYYTTMKVGNEHNQIQFKPYINIML